MKTNDIQKLHLSGDFAKLCGINKSTLHYYVSINLIQPFLVTENNYKYYSPEQAYTIHLINILQKSGCGLAEIRSYLNGNSDLGKFRLLLEEQEKKLIQERNELNHTITMLQTINHFADFAMSTSFTAPREYYMANTIGILCTPFSKPTKPNSSDYVETFKTHIQMCKSTTHAIQYPFGRMIKERNIYMEDYQYSAFFCFSSSPYEASTSFSKGNYVCCTNSGKTVPEVYTSMLQYILERHYTITGNALELSISIPHTQPNDSDYVILIFIPVA